MGRRKNIFYRYNPDTDDFERVYPTFKGRMLSMAKVALLSMAFGTGLYFLMVYCFDSPVERNLRTENSQLRTQYNILNRRLESSLKVMANIQNRDDNFYRVMMQMEPMSRSQRIAGLDNERRYKDLSRLTDAALVKSLTQRTDLLERQLYAQSRSFDELREAATNHRDKLDHIPSILPMAANGYTISSGYGYRRDPILGETRFHTGLDLSAPLGTPVYATADGMVTVAERKIGYGKCVDIAHGYNYVTRYAHLSEITVKNGQSVKRGDIIGKTGSSGKSTGPHLHYEVRFKDEPQNPVNYCFMDLTPEQYAEMIQLAENAGHVMD